MTKVRVRLIAVCLASVMFAGSAQARTVSDYLRVAEPLRARGMAAMFDPAYESLGDEANAALEGWQASAGRPGSGICAPAGASDMSIDAFLKLLRSYPRAKAGTTQVAAAVKEMLDARYRCAGR